MLLLHFRNKKTDSVYNQKIDKVSSGKLYKWYFVIHIGLAVAYMSLASVYMRLELIEMNLVVAQMHFVDNQIWLAANLI